MLKCCSKCKIEQPLVCFSQDKRAPDGLKHCCKKCVSEQDKIRYSINVDKLKATTSAWRKANPNRIKLYRALNLEKRKAYNRTDQHKRKAADLNFRIASNLRVRICVAIREGWKAGSAVDDLGCTIEELKSYIEDKFESGMSWDNWGRYTWHIDHIKPLSSFDLTNRDQFVAAAHYTNLQPLWWLDNLRKSNR